MQEFRPILPTDRVLQKTPSSFDVSVPEFFGPLLAGATLVLARPDGHRDPQYLAELIVGEGITRAHFVPSMLELSSTSRRRAPARAAGGRGQRRGAAVAGRPTLRRCAARCGARQPLRAHRGCGRGQLRRRGAGAARGRGDGADRAGRRQHRALRARSVPAAVTDGSAGELYLAGPQLARGYLGRPGTSADRFRRRPFGTSGARMYRTGDVVRRNTDGAVEYLGRADDQVKLRGSGSSWARSSPGSPSTPTWPGGRCRAGGRARPPALVGYLVAAPGVDDWTSAQLRGEDPAGVHGSDRPGGRRGATAEPQRQTRSPCAAGAGCPRRHGADRDHPAAGRAPAVASLIAEVLGREQVGEDDDFFALGGDSILAIRLVNLARREGISITPRQIFEQRTPRALARLIGDVDAPATTSVVRHRRSRDRRPAADAGGAPPVGVEWRDRSLQPGRAAPHPGEMTTETLTAALQTVLDHHDGLRQRLTRHPHTPAGVWSLHIAERGSVAPSLRRVDVAGLDDARLRAVIETESSAAADRLTPRVRRHGRGRLVRRGRERPRPAAAGRPPPRRRRGVVAGAARGPADAWVAAQAGETAALDPVGTSLREYADLVTGGRAAPARLRETRPLGRNHRSRGELVPNAHGDATTGRVRAGPYDCPSPRPRRCSPPCRPSHTPTSRTSW